MERVDHSRPTNEGGGWAWAGFAIGSLSILTAMQRAPRSQRAYFLWFPGVLLSHVALNKTLRPIFSDITVYGFRPALRDGGAGTLHILMQRWKWKWRT